MLSAFAKSVEQLFERSFRKYLLISILGSMVALAAIFVVATWLIALIDVVGVPWIDDAIGWVGGAIGAFVLALMLFPAVGVVIGFVLEGAARAVERRHYPDLGPARATSLVKTVWIGARLLLIVIVVNLLALPLYALTIFVAGLGLILYYLVNGYLFGREYMEMVALRRLAPRDARALLRRHRLTVWLAGAAVAAFATVPVVNLATPLFATAFMVHMFERIQRRTVS